MPRRSQANPPETARDESHRPCASPASRCGTVLQECVVLVRCPIGSCGGEGDALEWQRFAVLKAIRKDTQRQSLGFCLHLFRRVPVHEHAGQLGNFRDPPAVVFPIHFHLEVHVRRIPQSATEAERLSVSRARLLARRLHANVRPSWSAPCAIRRRCMLRTCAATASRGRLRACPRDGTQSRPASRVRLRPASRLWRRIHQGLVSMRKSLRLFAPQRQGTSLLQPRLLQNAVEGSRAEIIIGFAGHRYEPHLRAMLRAAGTWGASGAMRNDRNVCTPRPQGFPPAAARAVALCRGPWQD